jgi:hypothetical protein
LRCLLGGILLRVLNLTRSELVQIRAEMSMKRQREEYEQASL